VTRCSCWLWLPLCWRRLLLTPLLALSFLSFPSHFVLLAGERPLRLLLLLLLAPLRLSTSAR